MFMEEFKEERFGKSFKERRVNCIKNYSEVFEDRDWNELGFRYFREVVGVGGVF